MAQPITPKRDVFPTLQYIFEEARRISGKFVVDWTWPPLPQELRSAEREERTRDSWTRRPYALQQAALTAREGVRELGLSMAVSVSAGSTGE